MLNGALAGGLSGFLLGFVGPILISPSSPQGPLLGFFLTGPAGFLLGGVFAGIARRLKWTPRQGLGWGFLLGLALTSLGIDRERVGDSILLLALGASILGSSGWFGSLKRVEQE